jgi:TatD DNase family protein
MIDCHCHLEQPDYEQDRDQVIQSCRQRLRAIITCCGHPKDLDLTLGLVEKYGRFVFATVAIHPLYVGEISEKGRESFFELIRMNRDKIVGIGETGLDFTVKEELRGSQKELFAQFISLATELDKPLVIHARKAFLEAVEILESWDVRVLMHFFSARELLKRVIDNGWYISVNTALLKSKKIKKIVRDVPLTRLLTETDSPWLDPGGGRNSPLNVRAVIERIAEIKRVDATEVDEVTSSNALDFFNLSPHT